MKLLDKSCHSHNSCVFFRVKSCAVAGVASLCVSWKRPGAGPPVPPLCHSGPRGLWLEGTIEAPEPLAGSGRVNQ